MQKSEMLAIGLVIGILGVISGFLILSARSQLRDVTRIAHVRDLQIGLDLFFLENGTYPVGNEDGSALALGQTTTACLSKEGFSAPCASDATDLPYLEVVFATPAAGLKKLSSCSGNENAYCYTTDGESYRVQFELEQENSALGLDKGLNCLTENGFVAGACSVYAGEDVTDEETTTE